MPVSGGRLYLAVFLLLLLPGALCAAAGLIALRRCRKARAARTAPASGVIAEVIRRERSAGRGRTVPEYRPVIQYDAGGRTWRLEYTCGSREAETYAVGQTVGVLYDPGSPSDFLLEGDDTPGENARGMLRLGGLLAILFAALGGAVLLAFHFLGG